LLFVQFQGQHNAFNWQIKLNFNYLNKINAGDEGSIENHRTYRCFMLKIRKFQVNRSLPSYLTDPNAVLNNLPNDIKWRHGIPNYHKANHFFEQYQTTNHQAGSLDKIVQNLVQNWGKGLFTFLFNFHVMVNRNIQDMKCFNKELIML